MVSGKIIFLNGTSSSGKTTIAKMLQDKLAKPYMYISLDNFFYFYPERTLKPTNEEDMEIFRRLIPKVVTGLHNSVAGLSKAENNLIVDHVLEQDGWLQECIHKWSGLDVFFVGVKCSLEVLEQREKNRGDRNAGLAKYQYDRVHKNCLYDLEIDTSILKPEECVTKIIAKAEEKDTIRAFWKLQQIKSL